MRLSLRKSPLPLEVWIFIAALLIRVAGVAVVYTVSVSNHVPFPVVGADSGGYEVLARNLLDHGVFSRSESAPFRPDSFRTPGYPIFAAALLGLGGTLFTIIAVQAVLSAATAVLLFRLSSQYLSSRMRWVPVVLYLANPMSAYLASIILTETLFTFLLLASVVTLGHLRPPNVFWAGLLLGAATMVRPAGLVILPLFLLFCFAHKGFSSMRMGAWCLLGFVLIVAPWSVRNKMVFDSWQLSHVGTYNFYEYHATLFYAEREGISHNAAINDVFHAKLVQRRPEVVIGDYTLADMPAMRSVAWEYVRDDLPAFVVFYIVKTIPFFLSDGISDVLSKIDIVRPLEVNFTSLLFQGDLRILVKTLFTKEAFLFLIETVLWVVVCVAATVAVVTSRGKWDEKRRSLVLMAAMIAASALAAGTVSNARLREPVTPFLFLLATYGISEAMAFFRIAMARMKIRS